MLIKSSASIPSSEITDKRLYMDRRTFMRSATALATAGAMLGRRRTRSGRAAGVAWKETGERQGEQLQH